MTRYVVRIVSTIDQARRVLCAVDRLLRMLGYSERDRFHISLAAEEALVNAVTHGNKNDPEKLVAIRFHEENSKACLEVEDEGKGFDPNSVPDPRDGNGATKPGGRGILLMKSFMNTVRFLHNGRCVVLEKHRSEKL